MCRMPGMSSTTMPPSTSTTAAAASTTLGMNGTTTMSFSMSPMSPFFLPWGTYQLQLLFSTWNITEPWQFALSWIAVAVTAIFYQILECVYHALEHGMVELLNESSVVENGEADFPNLLLQNQMVKSDEPSSTTTIPVSMASSSDYYMQHHRRPRPRGWQLVKLTLAFVAALRYTLGLMLMLGKRIRECSHHCS